MIQTQTSFLKSLTVSVHPTVSAPAKPALDLVDNDLLADMETIDLSILGELRLNKIDYICEDISSLTGGFVWSIGKGLLGDLGDMDFSAIKNKSRSQGDLNMIMNVLTLVGNDTNSNIISKIAYGLGTSDGISLGLVYDAWFFVQFL